MKSNRLAQEKSPYLLQHAQNPVDWYPWGEEAFQKARSENKPIFLSVGYSTCHWCHVMERESFESESVAALLNANFVPVKVDREERPDVDRIYMLFVQASTGQGGWPMSVFLTPDLKPFFGGTYFPPDNRYGRPGFVTVLNYLSEKWRTERERILASGKEVIQQLEEHAAAGAVPGRGDEQAVDSAYQQFRRMYDSARGGFGSAPKFPRPAVLNFLLRYSVFRKNAEAREMVLHTLHEMAKGGMHDQLGGGFHRYSVDGNWFVPHFEKMLYDQGQLASAYVEAFQATGDEQYAAVARDIFAYVQRDLAHPEGGLYSAEDADSAVDEAHPHEKREGAFYVWPYAELQQLLPADTVEEFADTYGVEPEGNVEEDPHGEFRGVNILYLARPVGEGVAGARGALLEARNKRPRPHLDDKVLTAWNGLMISAFAKGAQALGEASYLESAKRSAEFIRTHMWNGETLLRRFRDGDAAIPGFLDDYAYFSNGLVDLYEATFDAGHLAFAVQLVEQMIGLFGDQEGGGFYSTAAGGTDLVMRLKEDYDGAEPSGNSIAALVLLRLANITKRDDLRETAERTLTAFGTRLKDLPTGVPQMMVALLLSLQPPQQVVVAGDLGRPDTQALLHTLWRRFLPFYAVLTPEAANLSGMGLQDGRAAAYVCQNYTCSLPTSDPSELKRLLPS